MGLSINLRRGRVIAPFLRSPVGSSRPSNALVAVSQFILPATLLASYATLQSFMINIKAERSLDEAQHGIGPIRLAGGCDTVKKAKAAKLEPQSVP
jgi:hypothetical protein